VIDAGSRSGMGDHTGMGEPEPPTSLRDPATAALRPEAAFPPHRPPEALMPSTRPDTLIATDWREFTDRDAREDVIASDLAASDPAASDLATADLDGAVAELSF
jgi:hypothetical protein